MISITQIRDAFKTITPGFSSYQVGKLNEQSENEIGFFHLNASTNKYHKFIGEQVYRLFPVQIIIHGYKDTLEQGGLPTTEKQANYVYETIDKISHMVFDDFTIVQVRPLDNYPVCLWTNAYGIYEFSIECLIYVSEKEDN